MSIRKDPRSPYWQYDFQRNGQRFHGSTGCTAKRDAERFEAELKRKVALGEDAKPPITLDQACKLYWDDKGQFEANAYTTEYQLANLCRIVGQTRIVGLLRQRDMSDFVAKRRAEPARNRKTPIAAATLNRELQLAKRVWKYARKQGFDVPAADSDDAIDWGELLLDEPKERVRELNASEEKRLRGKLDGDLLALVEFALLSGQRKSAIITLTWDTVDLAGERATVLTKGAVKHTFPLTPRMLEILNERPTVPDCDRVFTYVCSRPSPKRKDRTPRYKGKRYPFTVGGWARKWKKALKEAAITDFRFHDLRHTSATRVVRASGNLKAAQKLLGHTDIATTSRYAHVMEDDLRKIMRRTELRNSHGRKRGMDGAKPQETAEN